MVKTEYWEQGLDTDQVPLDILTEYCEWDTELTLRCMLELFKDYSRSMTKQQQALVKIGMKDIHNLAEMEWNGFLYDLDLSKKLSEEVEARLAEIYIELTSRFGIADFPVDVRESINFNSNDHLSALLYGGIIKYVTKEEFVFEYKDKRRGSTIKTRKVPMQFECPRIFDPVPKSELAKEGYYSTNEDTLKKIKTNRTNKKTLELLLESAKLEKLNGTYYKGFPKLMEEMGWRDVIHGGFNQCVTTTGRLSSTRPNLQNVPPVHKVCFTSRFV
jgi:DNA polymerase I-like protein with 3'-5' exonuclease and polymerase domains